MYVYLITGEFRDMDNEVAKEELVVATENAAEAISMFEDENGIGHEKISIENLGELFLQPGFLLNSTLEYRE